MVLLLIHVSMYMCMRMMCVKVKDPLYSNIYVLSGNKTVSLKLEQMCSLSCALTTV